LLDVFVANGILEAYQRELFPDHEENLRKMAPEIAAIIYDLTPDGESELWSIPEPVLNAGYTEAGFQRFSTRIRSFQTVRPQLSDYE
jgi:hypothetical protein|tara:strand:- start:280 stop:540 length:261 start_codon:yes stop_codon:yes gene_type:complete